MLLLLLLLPLAATTQINQSGTVVQSFTSRHYSTEDGLPAMQCTGVFMDSKGFLWLSTKAGTARWDGKHFRPFYWQGKEQIQQVNFIETKDGTVYWANSENLCCFYNGALQRMALPQYKGFTLIQPFTSNSGDSEIVISGYRAANNQPFKYKTILYNIRSKKFRDAAVVDIKNYYSIPIGDYLLETDIRDADTYLMHPKVSFSVYKKDHYTKEKELNGNWFINSAYGQQFCWNTETKKLIWYNVYAHTWDSSFFNEAENKDLPNLYFLGYENGKLFYNKNGSVYYKEKNSVPVYICNGKYTAAILSSEKPILLWLISEEGLDCYNLAIRNYRFNIYNNKSDGFWEFSKDFATGIYWAGSNQYGFVQTDLKNWQRNKVMDAIRKPFLQYPYFTPSFSKENGLILPHAYGFFSVKPSGIKDTKFLRPNNDCTMATIYDSARHCHWIAGYTHAFCLQPNGQLDTLPSLETADIKTLLGICLDKYNRPIFHGKGIRFFADGKFSELPGLSIKWARCSAKDYTGNIWFNSKTDSIYLYDYKKTEAFQLPVDNETGAILCYKKYLMVASNKYLFIINLEAYYTSGLWQWMRYDKFTGYGTGEGSQNAFFTDDDGSVWYTKNDELIRFFPDSLYKIQRPPQPFLDELQYADENFKWKYLYADSAGKYMLPLGLRNIQFKYTAAELINHNILNFRCRLVGYSKNWDSATVKEDAFFGNLAPGNYQFELQTSFDNITYSNTIAYKINIPAYWYETWWFKTLIVLSSIALIIYATLFFTRRKRKKEQRQKLINELQLKAIRSKSIPHFSGNAFASIDFYIEKGDTENASKYLAIMSRLHNITLGDSDKPARSLEDELNYIKLYLQMEKMRFEDKLNYAITVSENTNLQQLIPNMIIHTYTENAIKHGIKNKEGPGNLKIAVTRKEKGVQLTVTDDGIGRLAANNFNAATTKQGLSILSQQIKLYNALNKENIIQEITDMADNKGRPLGTVFSVFIPFNYTF